MKKVIFFLSFFGFLVRRAFVSSSTISGIPQCKNLQGLGSKANSVLIICEKPSVARDLSVVLGGGRDQGGYIPYSGGAITWARGHLMEMVEPKAYFPTWGSWAWETLPMIPPNWDFKYEIKSGCRDQVSVIKNLFKKSEVLVNACDAGREGELIWWEIMKACGWARGLAPGKVGSVDKPALRFWAQSNTPDGLREAWSSMEFIQKRLGLAEAAYCRSESDWVLGLNVSRATTLAFSPPIIKGRRGFWTVGRVQTPVLAIICERDREITNFVSKPFYEVRLEFPSDSKSFMATMLVPSGIEVFDPSGEVRDVDNSSELDKSSETVGKDGKGNKEHKGFLKKVDAIAVLERVLDGRPAPWEVTEDVKEGSENPPLLFSLTDLQKWCNQNYGWSAKKTLDAAQAAYESDKTLTYPRTDACHLPEDSRDKMDQAYLSIRGGYLDSVVSLPSWVTEPSRMARASVLFDDKKLTDHYAIVPTGVIPRDLSTDSGRVWLAVLVRFIMAFGPAARVVSVRRRLVSEEGDVAVASGKYYKDRGWIEASDSLCQLLGQTPKADPSSLAPCKARIPLLDGSLHEGKTTPPKPLTEATLLSCMENVSNRLGDGLGHEEEGLKEALAGKGLGTPATRAAIIELLLSRGYIAREKKASSIYLRSTEEGKTLIGNLVGAKLEFLTSPELTARWEQRLADMEESRGEGRLDFLNSLKTVVEDSVKTLGKLATESAALGSFGGSGSGSLRPPKVELGELCPKSGKPISDAGQYWDIPGYAGVRFYKEIAGRKMALQEVLRVIDNKSPYFNGFMSKKGKPFAAALKFNSSTGRMDFDFNDPSAPPPSAVIAEGGSGELCPLSGKPIIDHGNFWVFPSKPQARFWKSVAKRNMKISEYSSLLKDGTTDFLEGFTSSSGNKFAAKLTLDKNDKAIFDFGPSVSRGPISPKMTGPGKASKSSSSNTKKKRSF